MLKLGLVAPEWSMERVASVASDYKDYLEIIPYKFESINDIPKILDDNRRTISSWLFSGPLPFYIAKKHLPDNENLFYCRITEAGLLKCILEVAYEQSLFLEKMSVDFMDEVVNIEDILEQIDIPRNDVHIFRYSVPLDEDALFRFHYDLWKEKKSRCAVTTIPTVYNRLKSVSVPAYNVQVSDMEIRLTIELLMEKERSLHFRNSQLSLLIIEISNYENVAEKAKTPYQMQLLELNIYNALLGYCEDIYGYLVSRGNGRYEIFGSRGKIEKTIGLLNSEMEKISISLETELIAGIGFGDTVFIAQINSSKALKQARKNNGLVVIDGDGCIVEYAGSNDKLSYSISSENSELNELLQKANVGIRTYNKMRALSEYSEGNRFTALSIARQMGVTGRNLRRIISGLLSAGLIVCVGEEASGERGRPAKVYKFK